MTQDEASLDAFIDDVGLEFIRNQGILMDLKGWILEQPETPSSGYVDQINDAATLSTRLLWYGDDAFQEKVLARATTLGVKASIEHRSMSLQQISEASERIWQKADWYAEEGFIVQSIAGVGLEDSGLEISGVFTARSASMDASQGTTTDRQALVDSMQRAAGVGVSLVEAEVVSTAGRSADSSPFYAGGYMLNVNNEPCSVAFALMYAGVSYTTTANHCRGTWHARDDVNVSYGSPYIAAPLGGAYLLSSRATSAAWDGAWNNTTYTKRVTAYRDVSLNDVVCTDGGNSGVHCNVKVTNMRASYTDSWGLTFDTIVAQQTVSGQIAAMGGDSGGAVIFPFPDGTVGAVGMMQNGTVEKSGADCGGARDTNNSCGATVGFTSMRTIAESIGATLITG